MSDLGQTRSRRPPEECVSNRKAALLVRPFVSKFEGWNLRAARASATIFSHLTTPAEKAKQFDEIRCLRGEVEAAYGEFEIAVGGYPRHGRVADVEAAFERLLSILRGATG